MKQFSVDSFRDSIFESLLNSPMFPYMRNASEDRAKHPKREPLHLKQAIRTQPHKFAFGETAMFEIGDEMLERTHPYYHILQQAPVIRKRNKGTAKSKGSQIFEKDVGKRDYEKVHWNGKTFTKEYSKNVRGSRINLSKTTMHIDGEMINAESNQYLNLHYKYIDNILDDIVPILASEYGMKLRRKQDSGLIEEFADQEGTDVETVLQAFESML